MSQGVQNESRGMRRVAHGLAGDLSVWCANLDALSDALSDSQLVEPDRPRPARSPLSRESRRRLAARLVLRSLLADLLGVSPLEVELPAAVLGKPHLPGRQLRFSLSRSGALGLFGISSDWEVGVDLERVRTVPELRGLAQNHLTERERIDWRRNVDASERTRCFLEYWTRKEACGKALGVGLMIPPGRIEVGRAAGPRSVEIPIPGSICRLTVCPVSVSDGAVAAVAVTSEESADAAVRAYGHAGGQGAGSDSSSLSVFR